MKSGSSAADDGWCLHGIRRIIFKMQIRFTRFFQFLLEGTTASKCNNFIWSRTDGHQTVLEYSSSIWWRSPTRTQWTNTELLLKSLNIHQSFLDCGGARLSKHSGVESAIRGDPAWVEMTSSSMDMWHIEPASPQNKSPDEDLTLADLQWITREIPTISMFHCECDDELPSGFSLHAAEVLPQAVSAPWFNHLVGVCQQ